MSFLAAQFQKYQIPREKPGLTGLDSVLHTLKGKVYKSLVSQRHLRKQAEKIHELAHDFQTLADNELQNRLREMRKQFRLGRDPKTHDALALICECASRSLGLKPHVVQIMGVLAQIQNFVIEMLPGEGKTITAAMSAILAAWGGQPVHIVTSNDYLATRDANIMEPLYSLCLTTVSSLDAEMDGTARKQAYGAMVVYATSKELLADFLRDQMGKEQFHLDLFLIESLGRGSKGRDPVMRGLYTAIVDEADSVLADEATTPLIISVSAKNQALKDATLIAYNLSRQLIKDEHYRVFDNFHDVLLTSKGKEFLEERRALFPEMFEMATRREFLIRQSLMAKELYLRNRHYIIDEKQKIVIVDEATGRLMPMRSWGAGLHQAIEAKEGVELTDPTETHTRMSFQRFFRLYRNLSGMSGTLQNLERELWQIYKLATIRIPKRIAGHYTLLPAILLATEDEKWDCVRRHIVTMSKSRRPLLVGTRSIEESESLAAALLSDGVQCIVLNALHHEEEARIIALAGTPGQITIATNMAGRGTDILISEEVARLGGLHVVSTQRHESSRVDLQLYGRCARQGQPGTVQPILSLEDPILKRHCPVWILRLLKQCLPLYFGRAMALFVYSRIQASREAASSRVRQHILEKDFSLNEMLSFCLGK